MSRETKCRLIEDLDGPIPVDLIRAVTGRGVLLTGAWMPDSQEGPGGSYLPPAYRELLRIGQLARRADEAEKAYQDDVACVCLR